MIMQERIKIRNYEPKERIIYRLPYYPDRIAHHAIMNVVKYIWTKSLIQVINYAKYFRINFIRNGKAYYADSRDKTLFYSIHRLNHFPINFKITKYDWRIYTKNRKENIKPQI